jgi:hypothetical protein
MTNDLINGGFELLGGFLLLLNVLELYKHKEVKGVHWGPTVFFTSWGFWNLYYYPSLDQWFSFLGGLVIITVNSTWLYLIWYYKRRKDD